MLYSVELREQMQNISKLVAHHKNLQRLFRQSPYSVFLVEITGLEPVSKQEIFSLSTCLVLFDFRVFPDSDHRKESPYLLNLDDVSQHTASCLSVSAPLYPLSRQTLLGAMSRSNTLCLNKPIYYASIRQRERKFFLRHLLLV